MENDNRSAFSKKDIESVVERYKTRYNEFGYSPQTLGWVKGKQGIRFNSLTSQYNFENKHVLDFGCGFGDLIKTLSRKVNNFKYTGVELVKEFIEEAEKQYSGDNIHFVNQNILDFNSDELFDYTISSGIFNYKISGNNNYDFIEEVIKKALSVSRDGLAFDFLSDKVDFIKYDYTFHSNPGKILEIAYKYSRNVILKNDYMPFEFSLFIFKDDGFNKSDTIYNRFKEQNRFIFE